MKSNLFIVLLFLCEPSIGQIEKDTKTLVAQASTKKESATLIKNQNEKNILQALQNSLDILNKEPVASPAYKNETISLFSSIHEGVSFGTLKFLSEIYGQKGDVKNQLKTLKILISGNRRNPEGYFLLAQVYKKLYLKEKKSQYHTKATHYFNKAIQKAGSKKEKHEKFYVALLPLLKNSNKFAYLELAQEMFKHFKNPEYYTELCEAYYLNYLLNQSRLSCKKAIKKNPKDPRGKYYALLSRRKTNNHTIKIELIRLAKDFSDSYFMQSAAGKYFTPIDKNKAIIYLKKATKLNPKSAEAHKNLAWLLFDDGKEDESYEHFYQACLLDRSAFFKDFHIAKSRIQYRKNPILGLKFKKGIADCTSKG